MRKAILYGAFGLTLSVALGMSQPAAAQSTCGGIGGLKCPEGQACQYPENQCNTPDLAGICVTVPATCPKEGPKVCGCDGVTYDNACELVKAGAKPAKQGACGNAKPKSTGEHSAKTSKKS